MNVTLFDVEEKAPAPSASMVPPAKSDRIITHLPKVRPAASAVVTAVLLNLLFPALTAVLQSQSGAAHRRRLPPRRDGRLPPPQGGRRQLQRGQSHRRGRRLCGENMLGQQVLQRRLQQELQGHHRRGLPDGTLPGARRPLQSAACCRWDTAGQERFKCIASTYYRGAQAIIVVFDLGRASSLIHARQWLEDAMKENDPSSVLLFLVGTKKDLGSPEQLADVEEEAIRLSEEIRAEFWAVSAKSGDGVRDFFLRVAALTFEADILSELERRGSQNADDIIRISGGKDEERRSAGRKANCC
ncbi:ras-related protein Rab-34-like isoform X2 [Entelurus aequoreus]|uniref:ras-related protein Rab-34-like isoform X2 n=1 Tax=Entelurus aequoreus TaxID=161455 RepID=UPI002B1D135B|nr:ras-related protein Rab-34-like isoform X2 [Entelurus aequoreus]